MRLAEIPRLVSDIVDRYPLLQEDRGVSGALDFGTRHFVSTRTFAENDAVQCVSRGLQLTV